MDFAGISISSLSKKIEYIELDCIHNAYRVKEAMAQKIDWYEKKWKDFERSKVDSNKWKTISHFLDTTSSYTYARDFLCGYLLSKNQYNFSLRKSATIKSKEAYSDNENNKKIIEVPKQKKYGGKYGVESYDGGYCKWTDENGVVHVESGTKCKLE